MSKDEKETFPLCSLGGLETTNTKQLGCNITEIPRRGGANFGV